MKQQNNILKIIFIGDIVGRPGRETVKHLLPILIKEENIDIVIANGENSAGGFGIQGKIYEELLSYGIDIITLGNHAWAQKELLNSISNYSNLIRPLNFPSNSPGKGSIVLQKNDIKIGVINLQGRVFMAPIDCPFNSVKNELIKIKNETNIIIVDFHAEATSEKIAMGYFLQSQVSAVIGTHTHVQTADEKIIDNHTAYITDVGMTGPYNSIIGMKKEEVMEWMINYIPKRFVIAEGDTIFNAVILQIDKDSGKSLSIKRINNIYKREPNNAED